MDKLKSLARYVVDNDGIRRVFHTFWQAAGGVLIAGLVASKSTSDFKLALAAAIAAGLAAVKAMFVR